MGWIKTHLPDDLHDKVKAYRDETGAQNMTWAARLLLNRGIESYETEYGELGDADE